MQEDRKQEAGVRWGPEAGESPGQLEPPKLGRPERAPRGRFGGRGSVREIAVDCCNVKCRMLATLGTRMRFGYQSGWRSPGRHTGGLDGESALQAVRNTPSFRVLG